jgi:hypothetical protein
LTPGERWSDTIANFDERTQRDDMANRFVQVGGYETVSTPAGAFHAILLRIMLSVNANDPFQWPTQGNYLVWWAPEVGAAVREERSASYLERGDAISAVRIRTQNTLVELASFSRAAG